jgi:antitoxin (DNA-binding transcriptional repressor) of toxin-antitoxin stability system
MSADAQEPSAMTAIAFDPESRLAEVLDHVQRGREVTIAVRGVPVARVVPLPVSSDDDVIEAAIRRMDERRKHLSLGGLSIKDLIDEGRP